MKKHQTLSFNLISLTLHVMFGDIMGDDHWQVQDSFWFELQALPPKLSTAMQYAFAQALQRGFSMMEALLHCLLRQELKASLHSLKVFLAVPSVLQIWKQTSWSLQQVVMYFLKGLKMESSCLCRSDPPQPLGLISQFTLGLSVFPSGQVMSLASACRVMARRQLSSSASFMTSFMFLNGIIWNCTFEVLITAIFYGKGVMVNIYMGKSYYWLGYECLRSNQAKKEQRSNLIQDCSYLFAIFFKICSVKSIQMFIILKN